MRIDRDRMLSGVGVVGLVAVIGVFKNAGIAPTVLSAVVAGAVYVGLDALLGRRMVLTAAAGVVDETPTAQPRPRPQGSPDPPSTPENADREPDVRVVAHATLDDSIFEPNSVEHADESGATGLTTGRVRIAKHGQSIDECEDTLAMDPARLVLAVADGASSSFGAGMWAQILVDEFVSAPPRPLSAPSFDEWVERCRSTASSGGPSGASGWWNEKGAEQGAFSTVVGAVVHGSAGERTATVMCLGDSCAFVLAAGSHKLRRSLPYEDASQFGSHPGLVGSAGDRRALEPSWTTISVEPGELLVLASDAVSEWLLGDTRRFTQIGKRAPQHLADLLIAERSAGHIVNDDLTVVYLEMT